MKIPDYQKIKNLRDLKNGILFLKKNVSSGNLVQYWDDEYVGGTKEKVLSLDENGPYPDSLRMYFSSPVTNKKYKFSVSIYHGGGGEWSLIETDKKEKGG